jgi:uncharacterized protein YjiS (DUF1127 family)
MASAPLGASYATLAGRAASDRQTGRALWTEIVEVVLTWLERARERRHLSQFNDHMLKDIGLSRSEVETEIAKPFWRA